ncbi:MAG: ABC transporter ATP-binding protein [Alphaproteobacteria bacterium]|nr:ABC transporter ATP-binding protein [Alphaproteobacteria bacterium]
MTTEPTPVLEVRALETCFFTDAGTVGAVDGLTFSIRKGDTLALVGESGCGKSVTALSILRLVPDPPGRIAGGEIVFEGRDLLRLSSREMRRIRGNAISMVFQDPMTSLNPVFTIGDQISEAIQTHESVPRRTAWRRSVELLELVRMPDPHRRVHDYPHRLSGGMRQRVMMAMAVACGPKILIADEPTTALDVTIQAQVLTLLDRLKREFGMTVLLITHDLGVVAEWANRVVVMYAGRKVEDAPVDEMLTNPKHPYTRGLIACVPHLQAVPSAERPPLTEVPGVVPSIVELGRGGCPFAPRCAQAMARCREQMPPPTAVVEGHQAACWLLEEATEA